MLARLARTSTFRLVRRSCSTGPATIVNKDVPSAQSLDPNRFDEWGTEIPEDLRLPDPADPLRRLVAGAIDSTLSVVVGGLVGSLVYQGTAVYEVAEAAGVVSTCMAWLLRDAVIDEGNRSIGKKLQNLEIVRWDGALVSRSDCLKRNLYWLVFPFMYFHPLLNQVRALPRARRVSTF